LGTPPKANLRRLPDLPQFVPQPVAVTSVAQS